MKQETKGRTRATWILAGLLAFSACTGEISESASPQPRKNAASTAGDSSGDTATGSSGSGATAQQPGSANAPCQFDVGMTPLRRLTQTEYNNTVADLLGDTTHPADQFAPDEKLLGFSAGLSISPLLVEQYMDAAEALSVQVTANLPKLMGCDPTKMPEDTCATQFIDSFGQRAFRHPLDSEEHGALATLYTDSKKQYDFKSAVGMVVQAVLQSPEFLYRVELGTTTQQNPLLVQLTGYEVATRLSYFLWGTTPTPELMTAAAAGELDTAAGIEKRARMMLADARSHETVKSFHEQWLELDTLPTKSKDTSVYPAFDDALRDAMHEETLRFVEDVVFNQDGTVESLLTSSTSFINPALATLYGVKGFSAKDFQRTALDPKQRMGLLTQASTLAIHAKANQSSPVHRGKFVRERLLCEQLSPPPAGLIIVPPDPDPNASTRVRFAEHSKNPTCAGCHTLMDPIGFGFEHYDGIGAYRDMDGKFLVDATGQVNSSRDADGPFDGVPELAERLSKSQEVRECVAGQWFVYTFGRSVNNDLDRCSREGLYRAFEASGYKIPELLVALTSTDAFRYRRISMDGGKP